MVDAYETRHLGAAKRARTIRAQQKGRRTKRAQGKRAQSKKGAEQKGREITMLRHRYIQGRNSSDNRVLSQSFFFFFVET